MRYTAYARGWAKNDCVADLTSGDWNPHVAAAVDSLSRPATSCYTPLSTTMGTPFSPGLQHSSLCQALRWLAQGSAGRLPAWPRGVPGSRCVERVPTAERRKGRSMAKVKRPRRRQAYSVRFCAWCTHPVRGDAVTVTFP